jgi:hypothetical protein
MLPLTAEGKPKDKNYTGLNVMMECPSGTRKDVLQFRYVPVHLCLVNKKDKESFHSGTPLIW